MKIAFLAIFGFLIFLSVVAWRLTPSTTVDGKTPLVWVSDLNPARDEQIALFNKQHPTELVQLDANNQGMEKVIVQSLAGTGPDLFDCYSRANLMTFVRSGIAWDITDQLKSRHVDTDKAIWDVCRPYAVMDDRTYGFPTNTYVMGLWINRDIFDKEHIAYPKGQWTWADLVALGQKLTVRDASGRITRYGMVSDWWVWPMFVWQRGGSVYSADGTRCTLNTPEAASGLQDFQDLSWKYHIMPTPVEEAALASVGGWGSGSINQFGGGKAAMALGARWWLVQLRKDNLNLAAAELPHSKYRVFYGGARSTLINANSPHRQAALDFLAYESSPGYNKLINTEADGICPVIADSAGDDYLHDPTHPNEDFNQVWRDTMKYGRSEEISPYVNPQEASTIIQRQIDLIQSRQKAIPEALKDAQDQINAAIQRTIATDPSLKQRYMLATGASK